MSDIELTHAGVKGMKWGKRKAETTSGGSAAKKTGPTGAPTLTKAALLGSYGNKSRYTDPKALASRRTAGKLRIAAIGLTVAGVAVSAISKDSAGGQVVAALLTNAAGGVSVASLGTAAKAIVTEQNSRD